MFFYKNVQQDYEAQLSLESTAQGHPLYILVAELDLRL